MRHNIILCSAARLFLLTMSASVILFGLSACTPSDTLPTEVEEVGGVITKENDQLQVSVPEYAERLPYESSGLGLNEFCLTGLDVDYATEGTVKSWLTDCVNGDYQAVEDSTAGVTREAASLSSGGDLHVVSYEGYYYMVELYLDAGKDADTLKSDIEEVLTAYIGRRLASPESAELESAVSVALQGGEMTYIESLSNSASVYLMKQGGELLVQIR